MMEIGRKREKKRKEMLTFCQSNAKRQLVQIGKMNIGSFISVTLDHKLNCCLTDTQAKINQTDTTHSIFDIFTP